MMKSSNTKTIRQRAIFATLILSITLGFAANTHAAPMTMMQKAQHASPMPNLMMLVGMNKKELKLTPEQKKTLHEWKSTSKPKVKGIMMTIVDTEKELHQGVLEGITETEKNELRDILLEARGELMDIKYQCVSNLQKTLDKEQWKTLMTARERQARVVKSDLSSSNEAQAFLRVSPMPKLMLIIIMHSNELELTKEQTQALENWRLKNMNHWALLFDEVLTHEKLITQDALATQDATELMQRFNDMAKKRHEMAEMSLACRDNMKKVLNETQWDMVIKRFKDYM